VPIENLEDSALFGAMWSNDTGTPLANSIKTVNTIGANGKGKILWQRSRLIRDAVGRLIFGAVPACMLRQDRVQAEVLTDAR
jgi:hypothetical protein